MSFNDKLSKKGYKIFILCMVLFVFVISINNVYGTDFWGKAATWYDAGKSSLSNNSTSAQDVINQLANIINVLGTAVFMIVTIILGIKYMYGSIETRADIKESLATLIVAATFFFGWSSIRNILIINNGQDFALTAGTSSFAQIVAKVFSTFVYIANFAAIGGIIYVGIRYMISGASGKADIKAKSPQFILGIIMTFAFVNFLSYLSKVINSIF